MFCVSWLQRAAIANVEFSKQASRYLTDIITSGNIVEEIIVFLAVWIQKGSLALSHISCEATQVLFKPQAGFLSVVLAAIGTWTVFFGQDASDRSFSKPRVSANSLC